MNWLNAIFRQVHYTTGARREMALVIILLWAVLWCLLPHNIVPLFGLAGLGLGLGLGLKKGQNMIIHTNGYVNVIDAIQ